MADYAADISTNDYIYREEITITEIGGEDRTGFPVKLLFTSSNFNFELARSDGYDVRIAEASNGTRVLNMWLVSWDDVAEEGIVWFKVPSLLADEVKTLYVYWGNPAASDASVIDDVGFLVASGFDDPDYFTRSLSYGKSTAQSSDSGYRYSYYAVDGSEASQTNTGAGGATNKWWKVDLGAEYSIGIISMIKYNSTSPRYFYIQTADDWGFTVNVTNIATASNDTREDMHYYFSGLTARYLRVYTHTNTDAIQLYEFRVYEPGTRLVSRGVTHLGDSKIRLDSNRGYIEGYVLSGVKEWILEEGIYLGVAGSRNSSPYASHRYRFYGTNGNFGVDLYTEGSTDRIHNIINTDTWVTYNGTQRGLHPTVGVYSENYIGYRESNDTAYQGMAERSTYQDYDDSWERVTHGDTRMDYFRIYGRVTSVYQGSMMDLDWVLVREFFETDPYSFDTSNLYVPYETVHHETIDWTSYDDDVTDVDFFHTTESGGDPHNLSDNISGSTSNCWYSDDNTAYAEIFIDFGRGAEDSNLVSTEHVHYDDGHVGYYNASKLSSGSDDVYFQGTTTSGYVCIDLADDNMEVGCLAVKAKSDSLTGMVKNFTFLGGYKDPRFSTDDDWTALYSGVFQQESVWQPVYFVNENPYRYYKLDIIDTYGSNAVLQEWEMYQYNSLGRKMIISQLRLNPVAFDSQEVYFPKQVELEASNNMIDWTKLMFTTETATPFYDYSWGRWQRFSFENIVGYYNYKLICYGNWNYNVGKMAIAEWEMVEKVSESTYHRVLDGTSNDFNSVWASPTTTFDNGFVYIGAGNILNSVHNNKLIDSTTVSGIIDINIV